MSLYNRLVVGSLGLLPKFLVGAVSKPYIAGETLDDALEVAADLNRGGYMTTLDILGEDTVNAQDAQHAAAEYKSVLAALGERGIDGNISVKPTQFGLKVDYDLCRSLFRELIEAAASTGYFVRVEMENSSCTALTVDLYQSLLQEFGNVGVVFQAYLHRSQRDIEKVIAFTPNVRIVKGVYVERESVAYQDSGEIRSNYVALSETLLRRGSYVAFATHDETLIEQVSRLVDMLGLEPSAYEFQMLLGVQERLRQRILESGRRVRVYVPFGADWYAYSMRRLRENPKIAGYVAAALLRRDR